MDPLTTAMALKDIDEPIVTTAGKQWAIMQERQHVYKIMMTTNNFL